MASAAAGVSSRMFAANPFTFMQPTINSDPSLAGVFGASSIFSSMTGCAGPDSQAAAFMGYLRYQFNRFERKLMAAMGPMSAAGQQGATDAPAGAAFQQQQQQQSSARRPPGQQQYATSSKARAVKDCKRPSDFVSLGEFLKYYTVDKIQFQPTAESDTVMLTRKQINDKNGQWSSEEQRASDLNIMYKYIEAEARRLCTEKDKHFSIEKTVQELARDLKIGQKGGISISQFRDTACKWNKEQNMAAKAAAAAAAAPAADADHDGSNDDGCNI